jgi:FMN phosphatase YigB (HAD superfamily)
VADERWVTFDVYGTMIDWMGGIRGELARLWPDEDAERLLERYHELEPQVEEGRAIPYRAFGPSG